MSKRPTIADVAKLAGVSRATVSLVLADSAQIPDSTKLRVRGAMVDSGYVYNRLAGTMRGGRSRTIGLVLTNIRNPYFAELSMSVDDAARRSGYTLLQGYSLGNPARERDLIRAMLENRVDGLILLKASDEGTASDEVDQSGRDDGPAVVTILRRASSPRSDFVGIAEGASGELIGAHLAEIGARTVAFVGGTGGSYIHDQRVQGVRRGLAAVGGSVPDHLVVSALRRDYGVEEAAGLVEALLDGSIARPDAIVAYNDSYAGGVYEGLHNNRIEPGADIAVASFDNIPASRQMYPRLTTVDTNPWNVGQRAFDLLTRRIGDPTRPFESVSLEPTLVVRESTLSWRRPERGHEV